jgi:hypothetical protein
LKGWWWFSVHLEKNAKGESDQTVRESIVAFLPKGKNLCFIVTIIMLIKTNSFVYPRTTSQRTIFIQAL